MSKPIYSNIQNTSCKLKTKNYTYLKVNNLEKFSRLRATFNQFFNAFQAFLTLSRFRGYL